MKNCTSCGAPLEDGYTFCPHCGASCSHGAGGEGEKKCPKCGAPVRGGYTFCISCGASLHGHAEGDLFAGAAPPPADPFGGRAAPPAANYSPPARQKPINIAGIAGLAVGIVACFFLIFPVINILLPFTGLAASGVGMSKRRVRRLNGFAIAGLVVGLSALSFAALDTLLFFLQF